MTSAPACAVASIALVAGAALVLVPAAGCVCTAIGWNEGFTLEISGRAPLPDGSYELVVVADGIEERVAFTVAGYVVTCADTCTFGAGNRLDGRLEGGSSFLNLYVARDGGGGPERVEVVLRTGAKVIASGRFEPDYTRSEPNGDGCGVAITASDELTW